MRKYPIDPKAYLGHWGIQKLHKDSMSIEEIEEQLWPEPLELQSVPGDSLEVHPKIQESNSEINDFWWDSVGSKDLWPEDKNENQKSSEEYIDCMYNQLFGSSKINKEALSTSRDYEEWIDQKYQQSFSLHAEPGDKANEICLQQTMEGENEIILENEPVHSKVGRSKPPPVLTSGFNRLKPPRSICKKSGQYWSI